MARLIGAVPARGGSQRLPRKNLKPLGGKPLLGRAIEIALACPSVDRVIVSTDDEEIAEVARSFGAEVPFLRPQELAQSMTPLGPVLEHLVRWLRAKEGDESPYVASLSCTTPLKRVEDVEGAFARLLETNADSVRSVTRISHPAEHPFWAVKKEGPFLRYFLEGIDRAGYAGKRLLLPGAWRFNGVVDILRSDLILRHPEYPYGDRIAGYEIPEERSVDIDTEADFLLCEGLLQRESTDRCGGGPGGEA